MCKKNGESVDHLLLHCEIAGALWNTIFNSVGLAWVMPRRVVDLFACWRVPGCRFQVDAVWKMIPPCLMWCLWREGNDHSFEDYEMTLLELKILFFKALFHWVAASDFKILAFQTFMFF
jgi:hypothetical protein